MDDYLFDMNAYRFEKEVDSLLRTTFWKPKDRRFLTLLLLYGGIAVMVILYFLVFLFTYLGKV